MKHAAEGCSERAKPALMGSLGKAKITDRPQLEALMNYVREGDTVIVESISRFGRNIKHFLELLDLLKEKQVDFVSVKEKFDSSTASGRFMIVVLQHLRSLKENIFSIGKQRALQ